MDRKAGLLSVLTALALTTSACTGAGIPTSSTMVEESQTAISTTVTTTTAAPVVTTATTTTTSTTTTPAVATKVEVNGTQLAYQCLGEGSPTALVEMGLAIGWGGWYDPNWYGWRKVLDGIAASTRVCIYGRRGVAGSDPLPFGASRTTQDQVDDLDALIVALGIETPLVLVGHSIAGYNLRVFADRYPEKVAGFVFVDATHPGFTEFEESVPPPRASEWLDLSTSGEQVNATTDVGDLPLYVITGTDEAPDWWFGLQEELLALSTNSIQMMSDSDHWIPVNDPMAIVEGANWVLQQVG